MRYVLEQSVSPDFRVKRDSRNRQSYFFLPADCLAATADFLFCAALLALGCFWADFFRFAFGDLSPMMVWLAFAALTRLRNGSFSEDMTIILLRGTIVNDG